MHYDPLISVQIFVIVTNIFPIQLRSFSIMHPESVIIIIHSINPNKNIIYFLNAIIMYYVHSQKPQMERYLSLLQLSRYVGTHDLMNTEQKLKLADRLLKCYHRCEIFNKNERSSEIM